ncbi:zinc finger CCHC domain-containing protein 3-like [Bufo bufo]|uniref:zinc finger CCHC domain-containing protein 3-like n=1 Tax=Bufo bufo TaxID=8384 RepID=UPI001ABE30F8|nr:zinc finger CCHC domain-containing protein 3-like [Bufo bufo]
MASDPGGGEGSWADDPRKAQSLECGLQHGEESLEMVAVQAGLSAAEERPSADPSAEEPQYRRLFSNVSRPANPPPQRRNAVRIRFTGPEENIPSRLYIGKVLLKEFMKFKASEVDALIHIPSTTNYDVSFKLQYSLDLFWSIYNDTKENKIWEHLRVIQLSRPQVVTATVLFQSEVVALADLELWLNRQCIVESRPTEIYDGEGIWNGGYTVIVQHNGVTSHLPHSYLGSERGICYYPGQPRLCHRCGGRHFAHSCSRTKCSLCGQLGHVKDECTGPVICNLCLGQGHAFRDCPHAEHNKITEEMFTENMEEDQEDVAATTLYTC